MKKVLFGVLVILLAALPSAAFNKEPLSWDGWAWGTPLSSLVASSSPSLEVWGKFEQVEGALIIGNQNNRIETFSTGPTIFQKLFFNKSYIFVNGALAGIWLIDTAKGSKEIGPVIRYLQSTYSTLMESFISKDGTCSYFLWRGYIASILCEDNSISATPVIYIGTTAFIESLLKTFLAE